MENSYLKHLHELSAKHNISLSQAALLGGNLKGKKELEGGGLLSSLLGIFGLYNEKPMVERNYYQNKDEASTYILNRDAFFNSVDSTTNLGVSRNFFNSEVARSNVRNAMTDFKPPNFSEITPSRPPLDPIYNEAMEKYFAYLISLGWAAAVGYLLFIIAKKNEELLQRGRNYRDRLLQIEIVMALNNDENRAKLAEIKNRMALNNGNVVVQLQRGVPVLLPEFMKKKLLQELIDNHEDCSICREEFSIEKGVDYCRCGHYYCREDTDRVLARGECATCRAPI